MRDGTGNSTLDDDVLISGQSTIDKPHKGKPTVRVALTEKGKDANDKVWASVE